MRHLTVPGSGLLEEAMLQAQIGGVLEQKTICERPCLGVEEGVEYTTRIPFIFTRNSGHWWSTLTI
jgi:hypothetical protein